ncbi:MAG: DUF4340 domain-containing protein [Bdellovibrionales bacterium]|nr:DUF4340 domain-containing protein [Bdellovibrionales bacterium]
MNPRVSLALIVLFVALGTAALFDPFGWKARKEEKKELEGQVYAWKDRRVAQLRLLGYGREIRLECAKDGGCPLDYSGDWRMLSPVQDDADPSNLGALLASLKNLAQLGRVETESDGELGEYGLHKPVARIEILFSGEKAPHWVELGGASAIGSNVYLRNSDNPRTVWLVASSIAEPLKKDAWHWRAKRILRGWETGQVASFEWKKGGASVSASKNGAVWTLEKPLQASGNAIMVEGLLNSVLYANAREVEGGAPPGSAPAFEAWVRGSGKEAHVKVWRAPKSARGAQDVLVQVVGRPLLYRADGTPFDRFNKPFDEFRLRRLLDFTVRNKMEKLTLRFPREKKFVEIRKNASGDWERSGGEELKEPLSQNRIKNFLDSLAATDVEGFTRTPALLSVYRGIADLELEWEGKERLKFVVHERSRALVNGELSGEARIMGGSFLSLLPIRVADLLASTNQKVVVQQEKADEHDHGHDEHDGHAH